MTGPQNSALRGFFKRTITPAESRDTGMAMVLLCLIVFMFRRQQSWVVAAMVLHVVNMTVPRVYRPIAVVWLGLSHILGAVMSRVLLSIVFLLVVTPMALVRRLAGKDSLQLRTFKASDASAMVVRNHKFVGSDLERPY